MVIRRWAHVLHESLELWAGVVAAKGSIAVIALPCVKYIGLILISAHSKLHDSTAFDLLLAVREIHDVPAHLFNHASLHSKGIVISGIIPYIGALFSGPLAVRTTD